MSHARRTIIAAGAAVATGLAGLTLAPTTAQARGGGDAPYTTKTATSRGYGGAVTSVDPEASKIGVDVLRRGGNAVDAAVATAAALGVTEPYSSGIGGGGYFVHYDARTGKVSTLDGRETAPQTMPHDAFIDPKTGKPYNFTPELVTSGVSVGTPGTLATWDTALRKWGRHGLAQALRPATKLAERGFVVDKTFNLQTTENADRFANFPATSKLFLRNGQAPAVGSILRNPDLARDVPADRAAGHPRVLPRCARRADRADRAAPAEESRRDAADPARLPRDERPGRLPRQAAGPHARGLPRTGRLRDGAVILGRFDRRRGAEHPGALPTSAGRVPRMCCTATSRRARSHSPTGASTSVTRRTSTCRCARCSPTGTPPSGPA